jgi:hypothetical protein
VPKAEIKNGEFVFLFPQIRHLALLSCHKPTNFIDNDKICLEIT